MRLCVPFNGQLDLLEKMDRQRVTEVYGKLSQDFVGGGRASCINPYVSSSTISSCVSKAHSLGLNFNYLLNASCMGNREWTRKFQKRLRRFLDWLQRIGVDSITVASPYLAELIKRCYPFNLVISSMAQINSIRQAKIWEEIGADTITLSQIDINRNFTLLREIRKNVKCNLRLIANEDCFFRCPTYFYHANVSAHASQGTLGNYFLDYCRLDCRLKRLSEPVNFIRASWIRPEDMHCYEDVGVNSLKIIDRGMTTGALIRIINAYTEGYYKGNLLDLLPHPSVNLAISRPALLSKIKYFFRPNFVNVFKLYKVKSIMRDLDVYIDNRALDGFIEFFLREDCELKSCRECGYCYDIAERVVKINTSSMEKTRRLHREFLDSLVSGDIFR
jgi:collagenase-like PrtC family protease